MKGRRWWGKELQGRSGLKPGVELLCRFEAAVRGWGALSSVVGEGLDAFPQGCCR